VHDLALRAQVLQGYEEFKVRVSYRPLFMHASGGHLLTTFLSFENHYHSLPMDLSRTSLAYWEGRRWSYSWRGSSRCGRGSGISRRIRNSETVSVRSLVLSWP
jgi:hypothetical protein